MYSVYAIIIDGVQCYIGYSKDLKKREYQHNYHYKKFQQKLIYNVIRQHPYYSTVPIKLIALRSFVLKTEAKRWEMYLILKDHFEKSLLHQKIPNISDM